MNRYEINEKLMKQAEEFYAQTNASTDELPYLDEEFCQWIGYDEEWMCESSEQPDGETMTEAEIEQINDIIKGVWKEFCESKGKTKRIKVKGAWKEIAEGQEIQGMLRGEYRFFKIETLRDSDADCEEFYEDMDGNLKSGGYHYMTYGEIAEILS